jgi:hypothetical protein
MQLSPKAIRFIIEALEHYQTYHEKRLQDENITEEDSAELANDCQYLAAIKTDLQRYHNELVNKVVSHIR